MSDQLNKPVQIDLGSFPIKQVFEAGWHAGFQEALWPDAYPWQDRCEVAWLEWWEDYQLLRRSDSHG